MELLSGCTLRALLDTSSRSTHDRTVDILSQLWPASPTAHDKGITHRDVKPENIFYSRASRRRPVKLIDFGLARIERKESVTQRGQFVARQLLGAGARHCQHSPSPTS